MAAELPVDDAPHGVSLARYAAVMAALAEPFPKGRVLALEELDPRAFLAAEVVWKSRIARPGGRVLAAYGAALGEAEDWLVRRVTPLHQEPAAWAAFLAAMRLDPARTLGATGLGKNDFARLGRHWARLAESEPGLGADVERCLAAGPTALPRVIAEPRRLVRSRVFQARGVRAETATAAPVGEVAAVEVTPVVEVAAPALALPTFALPLAAGAPEEHGTRALPAVAFVHRAPLLPFAAKVEPEEHGTAALPALRVDAAPLPFAARAPEEHGTAALPAVRVDAAPLPFAPAAASAPPPSSRGARPTPSHGEHGTAALPAVRVPPAALPFPAKAEPEEHGTAALPAVRVEPALPFAPRPHEEHGTQALPAITAPRAPEPAAPEPALTLAQYASLVVDLARHPGQAEEIGRRYGLEPAARAGLDAAWAARLQREPGLRVAYLEAVAAYRTWLAGGVPDFSVERYASLAVDLARDPGGRSSVLSRYWISEAQAEALDAVWAARCAADRGVTEAFERAAATYRGMLGMR